MKLYFLLLILTFSGCASLEALNPVPSPSPSGDLTVDDGHSPTPSPTPSVSVTPLPSPTPTPSPSPTATGPRFVMSTAMLTAVSKITDNSACAKYDWKNRGHAPIGYTRGMALTILKSACLGREVMAAPVGSINKDILAWYSPTLVSNAIPLDTPRNRLLANYTILMGSGMMESSGSYQCAYDTHTRPNTLTAVSAEGGLFQESFDCTGPNMSHNALTAEYAGSDPGQCMVDIFKVGADSDSTKAFGSGPGYDFQVMLRNCPAYAVEHAASGQRGVRTQWGPLNQKEAEFVPACYGMFKTVLDTVSCR